MHTSVCNQSLPSCSCIQIFMLHIKPHHYTPHTSPQECILFWPFHILCDHYSPALYFSSQFCHSSQLHLTAGIIQGYVWKHSCTHFIPFLIPSLQNTTLQSSSYGEERSISETQTGTYVCVYKQAVYRRDNWLSLLLHLFWIARYQVVVLCKDAYS